MSKIKFKEKLNIKALNSEMMLSKVMLILKGV